MLLGVYFHLAMNYVGDPPNGHPLFGLFMVMCHYFRMHAFFLISGFFKNRPIINENKCQYIKDKILRREFLYFFKGM